MTYNLTLIYNIYINNIYSVSYILFMPLKGLTDSRYIRSHHLLFHNNADSPMHMFVTSLSVEPRAQSRRQLTPSPHVVSHDSRPGNWKIVMRIGVMCSVTSF